MGTGSNFHIMYEAIERYKIKSKQTVKYIIERYFTGSQNIQNRQLAFVVGVVFVIFLFLLTPPFGFPSGTLVKIEKGSNLNEIAHTLKQESVIRSETLFKGFMIILRRQGGALSGDYFFENPQSVFKVVRRISRGIYGLTPLRVRFIEGTTIEEMSFVLTEQIPLFDAEKFIDLTEDKEGFLFPDTYFFLPNVEPAQVIREMEDTLTEKLLMFMEQLENSGRTLEDIIIMASIIEKEAITLEDKKLVSGVLWTRIEIGMALQVDAPFIYERNRNTFQLTTEELREDSPYNTYTNRGLTPTAIANPGLDSIIAALLPTESEYLFYLSDRDSNMHYAETFDGHKINKSKYLK